MTKKLRLSADYQCWPLWRAGPDEVGEIEPQSLPLKPETIARLEKWAETFDSWMDFDDPTAEKEPSDEEVDAFEQEGLSLWKQLKQELGPGYEVVYNSKKRGKVLTNPDQL
jgi:hypothetical protein